MNIVFFGTPLTAVPAFDALRLAGHVISLVVTQPDRRVGRSRELRFSPVKQAALDAQIEVLQPERVRTREFRERVTAMQPDMLVVVAYGRILGPRLLAVPPAGAVNLHFSLLPRYRGAAPVQWALARGDGVSGVTTMHMNQRMDEGDILLQRETTVLAGEHAPALQARLAEIGAGLLVETVAGLDERDLVGTPQDGTAATYAPILTKADGAVDLNLTADAIEGRVRGFDPWPGVWVRLRGQRLRLVSACAVPRVRSSEPSGTVILHGDGLGVVCAGETVLELRQIQLDGKRVSEIRAAINGRNICAGDRLEPIVAR